METLQSTIFIEFDVNTKKITFLRGDNIIDYDSNVTNVYVRVKYKNLSGNTVYLTPSELEGYKFSLYTIKPATNNINIIIGEVTDELKENVYGGLVKFEIPRVCTNRLGIVKCEIHIEQENKRIGSNRFILDVKQSLVTEFNDELLGDEDFPVLEQLILEVQKANNIDDTTASLLTTYSSNKIENIKENLDLRIREDFSSQIDVNNSKINSLETRLSNIIAHNGDGTKDTEIIDARGGFPTLGQRLSIIDSNGYLFKDYVETGKARYINSRSVGKGWGTVFSANETNDISEVIVRKSKVNNESVQVAADVTLTLFECDGTNIESINNAIVLETVTLNSSTWNEYKEDSDIVWKLNTNYKVNPEKYYGVTVYSANKVNCSQIGYNSVDGETINDGFKSDTFKTGIWTSNDTNTLSNYQEVYKNTYGLYVAVKGSNYSAAIKIESKQVEDLDEKLRNISIPLENLPFLNEYINVGGVVNTGTKGLQYDEVTGWATVIKGADFEIDKIILNKIKQSNISSNVTFNLYESNTDSDWINGDIILTKTMTPTEYNEIVGDFDLKLDSTYTCKKDKFYTVQVMCENNNLCLAQSGIDNLGDSDISEYFVNGYYYNNSEWNIVINKYGLFFELKEVGFTSLPKIKEGQVEGLIETLKTANEEITKLNEEITKLKNNSTKPNDNGKSEYIDIYVDTFKSNTNWIGATSNWSFNGELIPTSKGDTNTNNIKLNKPYHGDKRIMRFDIILYSDTVLDISMTRTNNNTGEGESIYQIDIPNNRIIMFAANSNYRGVDKSTILKSASINFNIVDGNKYLVEVEKNDFTYYFRIKDYLTANITEIELKGWDAGRQNHSYGFSWIGGNNAPKISNFKISMLNKPKCVFVGDSITEGVNMSSIDENEPNNYTKRYAEIIRNAIGNSMISAMGGDTIDTIIDKFDSEYNHIKPKAISVTIGTNGGTDVNTLDKFKTLIDNAVSINTKLIINLVPCGSSGNYLGVNELLLALKQDEVYKDKFILGCQFDVATAKDYYPYVDDSHPTTITNKTTRVDSSLMTDNTHPNAEGSIRMANRYSIDVPEIFNL